MTTVYLAYNTIAKTTLKLHVQDEPVDLLVSAIPTVLADFLRHKHEFNIKRWCLDSGAFSAKNRGLEMTNPMYIKAAKKCIEHHGVGDVYGLDVIGDSEATARNLQDAWDAGVPSIPTFHQGSDWKWLDWAVENTPCGKIALGGMVKSRRRHRNEWIKEVFRRVWPIRVHGFGVVTLEAMNLVPFHSVDASSWQRGPSRFGVWTQFNQRSEYLGTRITTNGGPGSDMWGEVAVYQRRSREIAWRWRNQLKEIE